MVNPLKNLKYIVVLYDDNGVVAVRSTEGKVFIIALPFATEKEAKKYIEVTGKLIDKKGFVFKRV